MSGKLNAFDRLVGFFSAEQLRQRARDRHIAQLFEQHQVRRFEGAAKTKRTAGWRAPATSANAALEMDLITLRNRSRDLVRNNPYAGRAVDGIASNMVGTGIVGALFNRVGEDEKLDKKMQDLWESWAESTECDADGQMNFYGLQKMVVAATVESGEVFVRRRYREPTESNPFGLQLQILEADFLDTMKEGTNGENIIRRGIEFDKRGRRIAYYFHTEHPGDRTNLNIKTVRVSAEDVIHHYDKKRPGQIQGFPWGSRVIIKMRDFDDYQDATLLRQKIAACFAVFVTGGINGDSSPLGASDNKDTILPEKMGPGDVYELGTGQDVKFGNPPAADGYESFSRVTLCSIAVGFNVPTELLTGDLSQVNFSSGRMGWQEFDRFLEAWRWLMHIPQFCDRSFYWFRDAAIIAGYRDMKNYGCEWTPPARTEIDPVSETNATTKKIRNGQMSLAEAIRQRGNNPRKVLAEIKSTNELLDKWGLVLDIDPRKMSANGIAQSEKETSSGEGDKEK